MSPRERWTWDREGGHSVEIDLEGGDLIWCDDYTPRGDSGGCGVCSIDAFLANGRTATWAPPPDETVAALRASLIRSAPDLARRHAVDRFVTAARAGDKPAIDALLAAGVAIDAADCRGRVALWSAIENGREEVATELVRRGADVTRAPPAGFPCETNLQMRTALEAAVVQRLFGTARAILDTGVAAIDTKSQRPVWFSAMNAGAPNELIDAIIARGSQFDPGGSEAKLAAQMMSGRQPDDALRWLESAGVDTSAARALAAQRRVVPAGSRNPLAGALGDAPTDAARQVQSAVAALSGTIRAGDLAILERLLSQGVQVNGVDHDGQTPLMHVSAAPSASREAVARRAIAAGCDVNAVDRTGATALTKAVRRGAVDVVRVLLTAGAKVDAVDEGSTPLLWAVAANDIESTRALLEAGANTALRDRRKRNALEIARGRGYESIEQALRAHGAR